MVYYSIRAKFDLDDIIEGLLTWKKHKLEYQHIVKYHNDIKKICESLDQQVYHTAAEYKRHLQFGKFVFKYVRNKNTTWYIIYNYDKVNDSVFIEHILSNHLTKSD